MIAKAKSFFQLLEFQKIYKTSKFKVGTIIEWSLLFLMSIVTYFIFMYIDITNTIDNSVLLDKAIFSGNFFRFYEYSVENASTNYAANYEPLAYIPFAIWNLPLAIANMAFGYDYNHSTLALLWSKGSIVIMAIAAIVFIYKIMTLIKVKKEMAVLGCYVFATSVFFFWPVMMVVQIDIPAVLLMLIGFYFYLQDKSKLFILFFGLAVPFKTFALILFVPLLLLKEKRVIFAVINLICLLIPELICKLLFKNSATYNAALGSQSDEAMGNLFNYTEFFGSNKVSFFIVAYLAICVFAYLYKIKDDEMKFAVPVYTTLLVWGSMMITVQLRGYWLLYFAPFFVIAVFSRGKFLKTNLLVEIVGGFSFLIYNFSGTGYLAQEEKFVWRLLLYKFVAQPSSSSLKYGSMHDLIINLGLNKYRFLFFTVFISAIGVILLLTSPFLFKKVKTDKCIERSVILIRPISIICLMILYLFAYTATKNLYSYNFINTKTNSSTNVNLFEDNTVSQHMSFDKDKKLSELSFIISNNQDNRRNFGLLTISIYDNTTDKEVYYTEVGCSVIPNEKKYTVKLKNLYINANDDYEIIFGGVKGVDGSITGRHNSIEIYKTKELVEPDYPALVNGTAQNYNLSFSIS